MCKGPRLERKPAASRRRKEPPPSSSPPSPLPVQLAVASPLRGPRGARSLPTTEEWRSRWGTCWAGDPKAPRPVAAEATAQVGALSPQPGGAGAGVASGRNPGKKGAFCPPGNSVGLGVCLCSHLGFSAPFSRRGKPRQGTWRTGLREAWVWGCQVPPLGLSRDPGKRQFSKLRSSAPPRSAGPAVEEGVKAWGLDGCGDPHTRPYPDPRLKFGFHPIRDLEGGGWWWDRERSAGTSPKGRSARNFTSHFRLGDGNAHSQAPERTLHFHTPARRSRCQVSVLTLRALRRIVAFQESGLLLPSHC